MKPWLALAVVVGMLAVPLASGATWERSGYDPGRTGAIPFEGPTTNDTAFQVQLPGSPIRPPVIVDDTALVATYDLGYGNLTDRALWRIDLSTGGTERVLNFTETEVPLTVRPDTVILANDTREEVGEGERLRSELVAREIPSGQEHWRVHPTPDEQVDGMFFVKGLKAGSTFYAGFLTAEVVWGPETPLFQPTAGSDIPSAGVTAVDTQTGEEEWTWTRKVREERVQQEGVENRRVPVDPTGGPERDVSFAGLSADDERVYPYLRLANEASSGQRSQFEVRALDAGSGDPLWTRTDTEQSSLVFGFGRLTGGNPVVTDTRLHIRLDAFQTLNPATGDTIWTSPAGRSDQIDFQGSLSMGATDAAFVGASPQSLYRLDPSTGGLDWQKTDPQPNKVYSLSPTVIDSDTIYVPTLYARSEIRDARGIEARDLETGELQWRWNRTPSAGDRDSGVSTWSGPGVAPNALVFPMKDGVVTVVGETEASLGEPDVETEKYPGEGEEVEIDASGAEPGAFGNATRYMVDWGDGTVTGWQEDPAFSHQYNESGEFEAQVYAGNDANQTSSAVVTMNVGEDPPPEPNWIEERFEKDNQDMTFGVLGVALAVGGGAVGATKRYRKRSRLEQELETLETGYEETKDRPGECEAFLETRRARARSLVLDGVLTEEQGTIVQDRADELRRELRTQALEDEFGFLPYSLVTKARQMLEDGRVTTLEVEAFQSALEEVEGISEEQRTVVRERLQAWKARDEGGGGR